VIPPEQPNLRPFKRGVVKHRRERTNYYLLREDASKMPIIKFVVFFGIERQYKNQVFIFQSGHHFATRWTISK
jgi:hypothetical protein